LGVAGTLRQAAHDLRHEAFQKQLAMVPGIANAADASSSVDYAMLSVIVK
jgi:hypothetical protein